MSLSLGWYSPDVRQQRRLVVSLMFCVGSMVVCLAGYWLTMPLDSRSGIERHLSQPLVAFGVFDGATEVVVEDDPWLMHDRLEVVPLSLLWPPGLRWRLAGQESALPLTDDPAMAGITLSRGLHVLYGRVRDPSIVAMEVEVGGTVRRFPVTPPGFLIHLDSPIPIAAEIRWLDALGIVVWTSQLAGSGERNAT